MFHNEWPDCEICDEHGNIFPAKVPKKRRTAKQLTQQIFANRWLNIFDYLESVGSDCTRTLAAVCPNRNFLLSSLIADGFEYG